MNADDRRIARNTVYLYGRMLVTVWISLYTSRVVLERLGVEDYGIYGVVGGIVIILSFLNGTLSNATARFISFEMGVGNGERLNFTFASSMHLHLAVAAVVLVLGETAGLWYVNNQLVIPPERMAAANICYQLSMLAVIAGIIQVPYYAVIMAHEHMDAVAVIAVVNVVLKLGAALGISLFATSDTLAGYSLLMAIAAVAVLLMHVVYARRRFPESCSMHCSDKSIRRSMLRFGSWDIYGSLCYSTRVYGIIVILNRFGGAVLNAAGSLTLTVSGTITAFSLTVVSAFRPQIIKGYASRNFDHALTLLYNAALYSMLLMALLVIPFIVEAPMLLKLWLGDVPAYTVTFSRLALIAACAELLITVVTVGIHATGSVMRLSLIGGSLNLLQLPLMWWLLRITSSPPSVYAFHIFAMTGILFADTLILKRQWHEFSLRSFWWRGVAVPALVCGAAMTLTVAAVMPLADGWGRLLLCCAVSTLSLCGISWLLVLPREAKDAVRERIATFCKKRTYGE